MSFRSSNRVVFANYGPPSGDVAIGNIEDTGLAPTVPHSDHTHAFPAPPAGSIKGLALANEDGNSVEPARVDHQHEHSAADHEAGGLADLTSVFAQINGADELVLSTALADAATAGASGALPATPAGYLEVVIGGVGYKLVIYNP